MLADADLYWHAVTGNAIRGDNGPPAMETKLGYVRFGPVHDSGNDDDTSTNLIATHLCKAETIINLVFLLKIESILGPR